MAVNYQTGVATDPTDLLTKLRTWAVTNGWTDQAPSSGDTVLSRNGIFCGIDATATEWRSRGALAYSGAAAYDAQTNNAGVTDICTWGAGPFTAYHFYVGDEGSRYYAHVTVEVTAGQYAHWALGQLIKSGADTGGTYVESTRASTSSLFMPQADSAEHRSICDANVGATFDTGHIWWDYDTKSNNWQRVRSAGTIATTDMTGSFRSQGILASLISAGDQSWNLRTPLYPMNYYANRASSRRSPIGRIPNMRFVHLQNFSAGDSFVYGGETWQIFPMLLRRNTQPTSGNLSSGLYGYAHRR